MCNVVVKALGQLCVTLISFDDYTPILGALTSKIFVHALTLSVLVSRMLVQFWGRSRISLPLSYGTYGPKPDQHVYWVYFMNELLDTSHFH